MNHYFITGTSSGIGKALAELLLKDNNNFVSGISRSYTIKHRNYEHHSIDLNDLDAVKNFKFPGLESAESVVLVNNAAHVGGEISHFENLSADTIIKGYNINIISPALLANNFLKAYQANKCKRVIMNISSGAAKKPIESWSIYCSSKAALEMLSEVMDLEQKLIHSTDPVYVFSVAPGIVDTKAQENIRNTSPENFRGVTRFIEFKENNELASPEDVAGQLLSILSSPEKFETVSLDVRNL